MNRLELYISAWIDLACAMVSILTLGFYWPGWDMRFRVWATIRDIRKRNATDKDLNIR